MTSMHASAIRSATKKIRCATYTRVSTDQGLDQEFNSLDAQREAAEAYIKSQAHEGWTCLQQNYDDGGFSGGSMERPALQQLLEDVKARKLDIIVVYKVDRLTRSLADFAKLVELFDAYGVSFVSVTQSFNTTSSMGRLTLNVLLSFAQFEREVTGERIRDKVSASRRKGMWMGGVVPLGFRLEHKKLIIAPKEAETVRRIFSLYLELQSLPKLAVHLQAMGIQSRQRSFEGGKTIGGQTFRTGALSHLLSNRIYVGDVRHHKQHYPGEHEAILDRAIFDAVQLALAARLNRSNLKTSKSQAALRGLLFDSNGNRMIPSHANKAGLRYCYYQSWVLNLGQKHRAGVVSRVPALDIEEAVKAALFDNTKVSNSSVIQVAEGNDGFEQIARIDVLAGHLRTTLKPNFGSELLSEEEATNEQPVIIVLWSKPPMRRKRELIAPESDGLQHRPIRSEARSRLLKTIAQGRIWLDQLVGDCNASIAMIAKAYSLSDKSVRATLSLTFLAPDIVEAAIDGRLHRGLTVTQMTGLPAAWQEQRQTLGLV